MCFSPKGQAEIKAYWLLLCRKHKRLAKNRKVSYDIIYSNLKKHKDLRRTGLCFGKWDEHGFKGGINE